jgi:hypothetical protein
MNHAWGATMAQRYADLEIGLRWVPEEQALDVGLRFVLSDASVDNWVHLTELLKLDLPTLAKLANNTDGYAEALTDMILARPDIAEFYTGSVGAARGRPIHVRLNLDGPPALHRVRWELLRDPKARLPIATTSEILFSRYLTSPDFRLVPWRTEQATRALVVIAGPSDLDNYSGGRRLAPVDVARERELAETALDGLKTVYLADRGQATLTNIARELVRDVDILYLVCHGGITSDVPFVLLEDDQGKGDPIDGRRLEEMVFSLPRRPTLAMLNSCQSAGEGGAVSTADEGILAGLGPRLAGAGIATVIAMQGDVSMETARLFATRFFAELRDDGVVDRAVAAARRVLREQGRPDWWVPALFSRLRSGRTYFKAAFTEQGEETWEMLQSAHRTSRLTPVLGPGMTDGILGSREAIARRWIERWQMPLASHNREDLAAVAQYLRVNQKVEGAVLTLMAEYLQEEICERITKAKPGDPFEGLDPTLPPQTAIMDAGRRLLQRDEGDVYRTVAAMPVPVFVTTNWTRLLEQALEARTPPKKPKTLYFPWNDWADWPEPSVPESPTADEPLVYHLFGRLDDPDSLVLTEDDYFEWLKAWVAGRELVPGVITRQLTTRSLLFLGYHLDDWEFRTVFQCIKSIPASTHRFTKNRHVGVQLSPGGHMVEPEAAQEYLESYFRNDMISIYWSDTRTFLDEYRRRTGIKT